MKNWVLSCREKKILFLKNSSIMEKKPLGSKIDSKHRHTVTMSLFGYVYKKTISTKHNISTFFDRFLEFSNVRRCEKLLYLCDISRTRIIEKREVISFIFECKFVLIHIRYDKILFLIVAYFREKYTPFCDSSRSYPKALRLTVKIGGA